MLDWKKEIRERLARLRLAPTREAEIVDELSQHLEDRYEELLIGGATEEEAYRATLVELSESELLAHRLRRVERPVKTEPVILGARSVTMLRDLGQDVSYGVQMLIKSPRFTAVAVLTLALGIGANTAIFSVIDALVLRRLPVRSPEQLVALGYTVDGEKENFSYPMFEKLRDGLPASSFSSVSAVMQMWRSNLTIDGGPESDDALVGLISGNYFSTLGVNPVVGRTLVPDDDRVPGRDPVTVISHGYWKRPKLGS